MRLLAKYIKKYKKYIFINLFSVLGFILIEIGIPTVLATGINKNFMNNDPNYIIKMAIVMLIISIVGLLALILLAYSTNKISTSLVMDLRNDLFENIQNFSEDEYSKFGISRLITNTGSDAYTIMQFLIMILRTGLMAPIMLISSLVLIFIKSKSLAMITLGAIPLMLIVIVFINKRTKPLSKRQQVGLDNINLQIRESLTGLRIIRGFNNEEFKSSQFDEVSFRYADISKRLFQTTALISPAFTAIFGLVQVSVIYFGVHQVNSGVLEYGTLVAFIEYVFHALMSFLMLATVLMMYPRASVAIQRIKEVMDEKPSIENKIDANSDNKIKGNIEFKNVSFAYSDSSEKSVLRDVDLDIKSGETVAFIGSTGSGKSTLIKLLPRLIDVTNGEILIDGVNIKDYDLDYLRKNIGYVPQKSTLFNGSIKYNLLFGNNNATEEELNRAIDIAQAKEFIDGHQDGYERILSEGGTNLSGGQQQRLCIARALIRDVPIYIFDDSFSALDYKTDSILRKRLATEITDSTKLIVAQRVSTVIDADKIMVLDQGNVVGIGKHKELLKSCEVYYQIASSQLTKEELER